jgi:hypothetical protein
MLFPPPKKPNNHQKNFITLGGAYCSFSYIQSKSIRSLPDAKNKTKQPLKESHSIGWKPNVISTIVFETITKRIP